MTKFASTTTVAVEKTRAEIEIVLNRYGADKFGYATDRELGLASIQFRAKQRHVRFLLKLPLQDDKEFRYTPGKHVRRSDAATYEAWEQACRQRWRALLLCIKAKLEAVECGIAEFEDEFMAHIILPSGQSVSQLMRPQIDKAYLTGEEPKGIAGLLPAPEPKVEESEDAS